MKVRLLLREISEFIVALFTVAILFPVPKSSYAADTLGVWNVKQYPYPAYGDGSHDDTQAIQAHIDSAYKHNGGVVLFPSGNYLISGTLKLHSKVYLKGVGGTTFGGTGFDPGYNPTNFEDSLTCRITLTSGNIVDMVRTDTLFYQSGIENIALVGNRNISSSTDTNSTGCRGIYIPDVGNQYRSQAMFRNIIIYGTKGTGFYDGTNQHEINLSYVEVINCGWNGFTIKGQDCKISRCGAGGNSMSGFYITGGGSGRYYDVDAWGNNLGFEIRDVINLFFFGLETNVNKTNGLYIGPSSSPSGWSPSWIEIFRGLFSDNSTVGSGSYSDVFLTSQSNGFGPPHILFSGCQFMGFQSSGHPSYPIQDASVTPRQNVVADCNFYVSGYISSKVINNNGIYQFRDCIYEDNTNGLGVYGTNTMKFVFVSSNYQMKPFDGQVNASAGGGTVTVTLPDLNQVPVGTVYYISRADQTANTLNVQAFGTQTINNSSSVPVNGYLTTLMITQMGSQWRASKMVAP